MEERTIICKECGRELPESSFKMTRWGKRCTVCNDCASKKMVATMRDRKTMEETSNQKKVNDARLLRIHDFTPRELMEELARRGYEGKLTYTETKTIDITNF